MISDNFYIFVTDSPDFGNTSQNVQILELFESLNKFVSIEQLSSTKSREESELFNKNVLAILNPLQNNPFKIPRRYGNLLDIPDDQNANQVLQFCDPHFNNNNWKSIKIEYDGNCLFNVFATFLLGKHDAEMSKILRVYSTFELINNIDFYKRDELCRGYLRHSDGKEADDQKIETEIIKEAKCCAQLGKFCGYIIFNAIANILRRPIRLIHPILSNQVSLFLSPNIINIINENIIVPRKYTLPKPEETIHVLLCGTEQNVHVLRSGASWVPNHYVLLINKNPTS